MTLQNHKVGIIGAGNVGSTLAYTLMLGQLVKEIVIVDTNEKKAQGEAMDLTHGLSFLGPMSIYAGNYSDLKDAKVIVITAGAAQKPGESRIDLLNRNIVILKNIINDIIKYNKHAILLVVTNPVDVLSYAAFRFSKFPSTRVIGSGTVLDTSRLRVLIGAHYRVNPKNVHVYIVGEHGDSEFPLWSHAVIGGANVQTFSEICPNHDHHTDANELNTLFKQTKKAAYKIIEDKGATFYAIGLSTRSIIHAILRDESSILCTSNLICDYYGINDLYLGLPAIIDRTGISDLVKLRLSNTEEKLFRNCAQKMKALIKQINL